MFKFLSSEPLHQPLDAPTPVDETTIKCTTCYMCACRCGIRVHLREGEDGPEVRYIDGNPKTTASFRRLACFVTGPGGFNFVG